MGYALNKYRHYLFGNKFVFYIDYMTLVIWLVNSKNLVGLLDGY